MIYKLLNIIILLFVLSINLKAQYNYVPNYSFEQLDSCPVQRGQLTTNCKYWFTPMSMMLVPAPPAYSITPSGSSDYYNSCEQSSYSTPSNIAGSQIPVTGVAYTGFIVLENDTLYQYFYQHREYIEVKLNKKLSANYKYCAEFYYSMAELPNMGSPARYDMVELGILLTDTLVRRASGIGTGQPQNIYTTPQVTAMMGPNKETVNWIKVSGTFTAKGGEEYLTIGNFKELDTLFGDVFTYIYIDDVSLYYCGPDTTPQPTDSMVVPNVFTPNDDGINDKFEFKNQEQWEYETQIFNRWGHLIYDNGNSENWDGYYKSEKVTSGVYYYVIKATAIKTGKVVVYRGIVTVLY